jgi:hypothetical protein
MKCMEKKHENEFVDGLALCCEGVHQTILE